MSGATPPPDPGVAERVRTNVAARGVLRHLGAELVPVEPGRCVVAPPFRPGLAQEDGFLHAGLLTPIADDAAGFAATTMLPSGARVPTVELGIDLVAPGRGDRPLARGEGARGEAARGEMVRAGRALTRDARRGGGRTGGRGAAGGAPPGDPDDARPRPPAVSGGSRGRAATFGG